MTGSRDDADDEADAEERDWPIFEGMVVFKGRYGNYRTDEE